VPCPVEHDAFRSWGSNSLDALPTKELFLIISTHMLNKEIIPGRKETVPHIDVANQGLD